MSDITRILTAIEQGDARATDEMLPLVYQELRRLAAHKMAHEPAGHTLQPTALVHEAWLKLVDSPNQSWQNRAHFFGAAAEAMRRILIARARRKQTQRLGKQPRCSAFPKPPPSVGGLMPAPGCSKRSTRCREGDWKVTGISGWFGWVPERRRAGGRRSDVIVKWALKRCHAVG